MTGPKGCETSQNIILSTKFISKIILAIDVSYLSARAHSWLNVSDFLGTEVQSSQLTASTKFHAKAAPLPQSLEWERWQVSASL